MFDNILDDWHYYAILYLIGGFISAVVFCRVYYMDARIRYPYWDETTEACLVGVFLLAMVLWLPALILFLLACIVMGAFMGLVVYPASLIGKALRYTFKIKSYSEVHPC